MLDAGCKREAGCILSGRFYILNAESYTGNCLHLQIQHPKSRIYYLMSIISRYFLNAKYTAPKMNRKLYK